MALSLRIVPCFARSSPRHNSFVELQSFSAPDYTTHPPPVRYPTEDRRGPAWPWESTREREDTSESDDESIESNSIESGHSQIGQPHVALPKGNDSPYGAKLVVPNVLDIIESAVATAGSPAALARALRVTPSHVSRLRKGTAGVSAELSLRLSRVLGRPLLQGLRDDGHSELADLMQPLADSREDKRLAAQRSLDDDLAALSPTDFRHFRAILASLAEATRQITDKSN